MMSVEAHSTKVYWTNADLSRFEGFSHQIVALNWGGKRVYATWFSAEPGAMLGIQLIPMGPYSVYLAGDPARIEGNLAEGAAGGSGVQFGEYMVQYLALADPPPHGNSWSTAEGGRQRHDQGLQARPDRA